MKNLETINQPEPKPATQVEKYNRLKEKNPFLELLVETFDLSLNL